MGRCGNKSCSVLHLLVLACLLGPVSVASSGLKPLNDSEMADVSGKEGIALDLRFGVNMEPDNDGNFEISSGLGTCLGNVECRLALEFAGRDDRWLVLKDYFGYLEFDNLQLDAANLPGGSSPHQDDEPFQDEQGNCLLAGCDPNGLPALQIGYPDTQPADQDFSMFLNIGRVAAEFGSEGYSNVGQDEADGSVLGFRAANMDGGAATANIDGRMMIFGF